jgi:predicted Fe-Mo cluster-binding NifX family protein
MIVAVPVYDDDKTVCLSFGRTPEFLFFDTESNEKRYVKNPAADAAGGAGIKAASFVVDEKADALLTPRLGTNAADVLVEAEIKIYKTESTDTDGELNKLKEGTMEELVDFHAGFHGNH